MRTISIRIILFVSFLLAFQFSWAQSGVGIGTSNPNPNAILDIVSTTNDKGVLIPRLTTAQRTAMNASLTSNENGLMVFDSDLDGFYFWNGTNWQSITVVQDLQLVGNTLTITNNNSATGIDLAPFSGSNTDNQTLSLAGTDLTITGGNTLDLAVIQDGVNDADANPTNELQNLSSSSSGTNRTVAINGGTNATFSIADNDNSATNEIQDLQLAGNILTITNNTSATDIDLSPFSGTNTDNQTLSLAGTDLTITGGNTLDLAVIQDGVNDADANPTNELQNLSSSSSGTNRTVAINGGTNATFSIADNDNSATNELVTGATLVGTTLRITDAGGNTNVNLASLQDGVNDADSNPTNEIQDLQLAGNILTITNNTSATDIDLSPFSGTNTDNQTLSLAGTDLTITGGNTLDLAVIQDGVNDADANPTNELQNLSSSSSGTNRTVAINGGTNATFSIADNDNSATNELVTGATLVGTTLRITDAGGNTNVNLASLQDGFEANTDSQNLGVNTSGTTRTVTITGGTNATFSIADNDNSATNELVTGATLVGTTLRITDAGGNTNVNLVSLQDGFEANTDSQTLSFNGSTNVLSISGGNTSNLSVLDQNLSSVLANGNSAGNRRITNLLSPINPNDAARRAYVDAQDHTDNQTLSVSGNNLSIFGGNSVTLPSTTVTKDAFKAYLGAITPVPGGSGAIDFDVEVYDINSNYDAGKFEPVVTGIYTFNGVFDLRMVESSWFAMVITVDGVIKYRLRERTTNLSAAYKGYAFSVDLMVNVGEVVQFELNSGSAQQLNGGSEDTTFISGRLAVEL